MPVENIHRDGSLMFNKNNEGGVLADSVSSVLGMIHEDDEFNEADLKKIKDKDPSMTKYWRYLSDSDAKKRKEQQAEADQQAKEDAAARAGMPLADGAFEDSTGTEAKKGAADRERDELKERVDNTPQGRPQPAKETVDEVVKKTNPSKADKPGE